MALIISRRFGFNEPPYPTNWRRSPRAPLIVQNSASHKQLAEEYRAHQNTSKRTAVAKAHSEKAVRDAEWNRREQLYRTNRAAIEAAKP